MDRVRGPAWAPATAKVSMAIEPTELITWVATRVDRRLFDSRTDDQRLTAESWFDEQQDEIFQTLSTAI